MKLLHREDVEEAGYELPVAGLCANIDEFDLEALKFAGEWILADDENLVGDGQRQNFLYLVITGEVGIFKSNDQGQSQHLASLGTGEAFGEMAFLRGGVASADVQASGGAGKPLPAPLAGNVFKILVTPGQVIAAGDTVVVLEAMKMETDISAPFGGTVSSVDVAAGDEVSVGDLLLTIS